MLKMEGLRGVLRPWFGWRISLPVFEGPFELLLYLIEKNELDITKVSLAQVADQYMDYLRRAEQINLDALADFIAVGAHLLVLKSRYLLPEASTSPDIDEEEGAEELAKHLALYRIFRQKASQLREMEAAGLRCYIRVKPPVKVYVPLGPNPYSVMDLWRCIKHLLSPEEGLDVSTMVAPIKVSVEEKMDLIRRELSFAGPRGKLFREFLSKHPSVQEVIATFMAVLELVKLKEVYVRQERLFGPIHVISKSAFVLSSP
ncbi:MAG TPA: segregation/condensation protein A [Chloroflexi bacterium]|nr:segregation/condensation protein A [Chloroflexota bacterium]